MYNCVIILGATASGKTKLAVELAKKINGEIINADSQQLIKGLNVGTAKISQQEMDGVKHHLFDVINVGEEFSVNEFKNMALKKFNTIISNGKTPIIAGGTGFYINALLYDYTFGNSKKDNSIREYYEKIALEKGNEEVYNELKELDIDSANKLHPNDLKRVIRALEIIKTSGIKKSSQTLTKNKNINALIIGINVDREELYARINNRVDYMVKNGLKTEVELLKQQGVYNNEKMANNLPIGYSEWFELYNGTATEQQVIEKIKQNSRHYAKRQLTWFKKVENVNWLNIDNNNFNEMLCKIVDAYYAK